MVRGISHIGGLVTGFGQNYFDYKLVMKVNKNKQLRQILNKYPNDYKNDFLMVEAVVDESKNNRVIGYFVNNVEVGLKDENLSLFTTIAKVLNGLKIKKKNPNVFLNKNDYSTYYNMILPTYFESSKPRNYLVDNSKDINLIKDVADLFLNSLNKSMHNYFGVK